MGVCRHSIGATICRHCEGHDAAKAMACDLARELEERTRERDEARVEVERLRAEVEEWKHNAELKRRFWTGTRKRRAVFLGVLAYASAIFGFVCAKVIGPGGFFLALFGPTAAVWMGKLFVDIWRELGDTDRWGDD